MRQSLECVFGILTPGNHLDLRSSRALQAQNIKNTLPVDDGVIFGDQNVSLKLGGDLDDFGCNPRVKTQSVGNDEILLDFGHRLSECLRSLLIIPSEAATAS